MNADSLKLSFKGVHGPGRVQPQGCGRCSCRDYGQATSANATIVFFPASFQLLPTSQVLDALDEIAFNAEFDSYRISKERKAVQAEAQVRHAACLLMS